MSSNNRNWKGGSYNQKMNKFASINQAKGFGQNKDKIIWDSENAIQWIAAKDLLKSKFESEGIYQRLTSPGVQALAVRDEQLAANLALRTGNAIDVPTRRIKDAQVNSNYAEKLANIQTSQTYRLTAEFDKVVIEYEKAKEKFDADTAKTIKFIMNR